MCNLILRKTFMYTKILSILFYLSVGILLIGCNKDTSVNSLSDDVSILKELVLTNEEVSDFLASEDLTFDDGREREFSYDDYGFPKTTDVITPLYWGRKVENITRDITIEQVNDTISISTIYKTISGKFIVKGIKDSSGVMDTVKIAKPFVTTTARKVMFLKVNKSREPRKNWKPIGITLIDGKTPSKDFTILQLEFTTVNSNTIIDDPLSYWIRFAPERGGVALLQTGDSVLIKITITSQNEKPEYAFLRHSVDHKFTRRNRNLMNLVNTTGSPGNYIRVYEKKFPARLPTGIPLGRYNVIFDIMSYDSICDDKAPYMNAFWGMPYLVKKY